ncbi:MAG: hypothetical protein KGI45_00560 [Patescibacteria group bacterium]|nr:SWIB/MDM2 domain-containing protein [Patescibacteria group bacterium]MDE1941178.1 hypothetical protein [Patescibacteria group bacterium]MDE1966556.1 hypothetical protein [Patescibacteria group bacterium]
MPTGNPAFMQPKNVSPELAEIVGPGPMPRTEVVSKVWEYIKKNNLQDSKDKRTINPDEKLGKVLGNDPINMMKMAGALSKHIS